MQNSTHARVCHAPTKCTWYWDERISLEIDYSLAFHFCWHSTERKCIRLPNKASTLKLLQVTLRTCWAAAAAASACCGGGAGAGGAGRGGSVITDCLQVGQLCCRSNHDLQKVYALFKLHIKQVWRAVQQA